MRRIARVMGKFHVLALAICFGAGLTAMGAEQDLVDLLRERSDCDGAKIFQAYLRARVLSAPLAMPGTQVDAATWAASDKRASTKYAPSPYAWEHAGGSWVVPDDATLPLSGMDEMEARVFEDIGQGVLVLQARAKNKWIDLAYKTAPPLPMDSSDSAFDGAENSLAARALVWSIHLLSVDTFLEKAAAAELAAAQLAAIPTPPVMMTMSTPRTMQDDLEVALSLHGKNGTLLHLDFEAADGAYYYIETCKDLTTTTPEWITREILNPEPGACTWQRRPTFWDGKMSFRVLEHDASTPLDADGDSMDDITELSTPGRYPMDQDEDSIPDYIEDELGGDKTTPNPVEVLSEGSGGLTIERKSLSTKRSIAGFDGFDTQLSTRYLTLAGSRSMSQNKGGTDSLTRTEDFSFSFDLVDETIIPSSDCALVMVDYMYPPGECITTAYDAGDEYYYDYHSGEDGIYTGFLYHKDNTILPTVLLETDTQYSIELFHDFGSGVAVTCGGDVPGSDLFMDIEWWQTLSDPVTEDMMWAVAREDLDRCLGFDDLDWGEGFQFIPSAFSDPCEAEPDLGDLISASRLFTQPSDTYELSRMQYRLRLDNPQADTYYRATLLEVFTPDDSNESAEIEVYDLLFYTDQASPYVYVGVDDGIGDYRNPSEISDENDYLVDCPADLGSKDVGILSVDIVSVDATDDIGPTKINYRVNPSGVSIPSITFTAPGITETRADVSGDFYFTYNQSDLPYGESQITLEYLDCEAVLTVNKEGVGTGQTEEIIIATIPIDPGWVHWPISHQLSEGYARITYSGAPVLPDSYTLHVGGSHVTLEADETVTIDWADEKHRYHDDDGTYNEQEMTLFTGGQTLPPTTAYRKFYNSMDDRFFIPGKNLEGFAQMDSVELDGILPLNLANENIDQELE